VRINSAISSVRPYLEPGGAKFYLRFTPTVKNAAVEGKTPFPFLLTNETDALARTISGEIVSDAGSTVKRVSVLLQRDEYRFTNDDLNPVTNTDVERCWQGAFSLVAGEGPENRVVVFSGQKDANGAFMAFEPLFFCKQREMFFQPVCPACGASLQQCCDDETLAGAGLSTYSGSLRRYLFCRSCFDVVGSSEFYTYRLEDSDPPTAKDRWDLIKGLGKLNDDRGRSAGLPCAGCAEHEACYGTDGLASKRIVPVAFYPFYMLVVDAMSLNGSDFLQLLSGARFEDVERRWASQGHWLRIPSIEALRLSKRDRTCFFFDGAPRFFLEVLYLKLTFLEDVLRQRLSTADSYRCPGLGFGLDRVWVKMPQRAGLLPFFWNFEPAVIDIAGAWIGSGPLPTLGPAYALHYMGLAWFYALLVNSRQEVQKVYEALGNGLHNVQGRDNPTLEEACGDAMASVFVPENIFWNPEAASEAMGTGWDYSDYWHRALNLGWVLLMAGGGYKSDWDSNGFQDEIQALRQALQQALFAPDGATAVERPQSADKVLSAEGKEPDSDTPIFNILSKIGRKWQARLETKLTPLEEQATLISGGRGTEGRGDELDKTVIVGGVDGAATEKVFETLPGQQDDGDVQQTVILSVRDFEADAPMVPTAQDVVPETVMIDASTAKEGGVPRFTPSQGATGAPPSRGGDLPETMMISPSGRVQATMGAVPGIKTRGREDAIAPPQGSLGEETEEDGLAETVIIRPGKPGKK
jgi:hypothetical protein